VGAKVIHLEALSAVAPSLLQRFLLEISKERLKICDDQ
jgi:hypothetical protein